MRMQRRVSCRHCAAHRDLAIAPRCLVCGREVFDNVEETAGDRLDGIDRELLAAAEAVDFALMVLLLTHVVPGGARLQAACRARALALAGRKSA